MEGSAHAPDGRDAATGLASAGMADDEALTTLTYRADTDVDVTGVKYTQIDVVTLRLRPTRIS